MSSPHRAQPGASAGQGEGDDGTGAPPLGGVPRAPHHSAPRARRFCAELFGDLLADLAEYSLGAVLGPLKSHAIPTEHSGHRR